MLYEEVAEEFKNGSKIRRTIWGTFDYIFVGMNSYGKPDICNGVGYPQTLTTNDLFADDWELMED